MELAAEGRTSRRRGGGATELVAEGRRGGRSGGGAGRLDATGGKGGAEDALYSSMAPEGREARASSAAPEGREERRRRGRKRRREIEGEDDCSPIPREGKGSVLWEGVKQDGEYRLVLESVSNTNSKTIQTADIECI
jgi:hypothetical protein